MDISQEILTEVMALQAEVSRRADHLSKGLGSLLVCRRGCDDCCQDDLSVFPIEAEVIRQNAASLLQTGEPHPTGKCAFLDADGACRIYPWRPYVCRTQGLPLRWLENDEDEERGICALNADEFERQGKDLSALQADDCWTIGEIESRLAGLQVRALGIFQEALPRVMLRNLFLFLFSMSLFFTASPAISQEASFGDLVDDGQALFTMENTWWLLAGTGMTFIAYEIEDPEGAVRGLDQGIIDPIVDFGNIWGDARVQIPLALGSWAVGSYLENDELALAGYDLTRGLFLTYGIVSLGKVMVQRTRPNGEPYSFPSGHTAMAFTTAGVLSRHYGTWGTVAGVGLGVLTGLGRMEDSKHYASDVVAGATIGWIIGRTVARRGPNKDSAWQLVPSVNGMVLVGRFN